MNKLNKYLAWLFALDFIIIVLSLGKIVYAEEYEDAPVEAPPAAVEPTPAEETPPPAAEDVARVPVEIDADALAEALTQALATPTPEPTTVPTIWDKPFNDYSPTEGLLLVIFVALCFTALLIWLR